MNAASEQDRRVIQAEVTRAHQEVGAKLDQLVKLAADSSVPNEDRVMVSRIQEIETRYAPVALGIVVSAFGITLPGFVNNTVSLLGSVTVPLMSLMLGVSLGAIGWVGGIAPLALTVALTALELLVAFLQAYVFAILTCIYLNDAIHPGH